MTAASNARCASFGLDFADHRMKSRHFAQVRFCPAIEHLQNRLPLASLGPAGPTEPIELVDVNRDGVLDLQDMSELLAHFGAQGEDVHGPTDLNGNGLVDFEDFLLLSTAFQRGKTAASSTQLDSVSDRTIGSEGYDEFKIATQLPAVSPALGDAQPTDLIVEVDGLLAPNTVTAVVLKPREVGPTYDIPVPDAGANTYDFVHDHFDSARQQGAGVIRFPPNHYFSVSPPIAVEAQPAGALEQEAHLNIRDFTDVEIDFNGSVIQLQDKALGIRIENSERVVLRNGTLIGQGLLSTIAKVEPDDTTAGIRFDVLSEFRDALEESANGMPDLRTVGTAERDDQGSWRIQAEGYAELFTNRGKPHNNFMYADGSFVATDPLLGNVNPFTGSDHVWLLHENNSAHGVLLDNELGVEDITIEAMQFSNIPGMVIVGEIRRGLHLNQIAIEPTSESPFLAASSDAIHINSNGGDIVVENSLIGPNGDDKINIKGNYWQVTNIDYSTNTLTVEPVERGNKC